MDIAYDPSGTLQLLPHACAALKGLTLDDLAASESTLQHALEEVDLTELALAGIDMVLNKNKGPNTLPWNKELVSQLIKMFRMHSLFAFFREMANWTARTRKSFYWLSAGLPRNNVKPTRKQPATTVSPSPSWQLAVHRTTATPV